ncbi:hypothetical protein ACS0TY_016927 [Phlomoides rotata]
MESTSDTSKSTPPQIKSTDRRKGGLKTMPFIIANEAFEKIAGYGLMPNMILYLITSYNFSAASGTSTLFIWIAISNFMPILGAFFSDSYFGRFLVISFGTVTVLSGLILLWLTAILKEARPEPGVKPHVGQYALLFSAFALMAIGAGGIRPCSMAFGADQFNDSKNPKNERVLQSFFNWYYASVGISLMVALTVVVYIQNEWGWVVGFGVPVGLMLVSAVMFFLGSKMYVKVKPNKSLLTGLTQVLVASWKKRHLVESSDDEEGFQYYYAKDSKARHVPSHKLRFLNKACIIRNPEKEINLDGSASDPWTLCSVIQVEVLKSLIELLPIWSTGIMIGVTISQHTFPVLQAGTLDRRLVGDFKIPPGSFGLFGVLTLTLWVTLYDRIIVPILFKRTNNARGIRVTTRIGIGLFVSCLAMAAAALVERARRAKALHQGLADYPKTQVEMSAMWLIPQHCLAGLGEAFNAIGQIELYYSQFPKSMGSIAVALFTLGMAFANLVGSAIVSIVNVASKRDGKDSWVSNNLNKGHYDYYYWILCLLSVLNLIYFFFCSQSYKCGDDVRVWDDEENEEEKSKDGSISTYLSA